MRGLGVNRYRRGSGTGGLEELEVDAGVLLGDLEARGQGRQRGHALEVLAVDLEALRASRLYTKS
jgi:hypothetical protein